MMENEKSIWRRMGDWFVEPEYRSEPDQPILTNQGSVGSAGGDSPLLGVIPYGWNGSVANPPAYTGTDPNDVTPDEALTIGTVFRAIDVIVTSVAQMEVGVYRQGIEIPVKYDNSNLFIRKPNDDDTMAVLIQETAHSLALWGNAYWYVEDAGTKNVKVFVQNAANCSVGWEKGKKTYYIPGFDRGLPAHSTKNPQPKSVIHLKHTRRAGHDYGYGPVQLARAEIKAALMLRKFQNEWFDTGKVPPIYLRTDQKLAQGQPEQLSDGWASQLERTGKPPVVSQGLEVVPLRIRPQEAQLLDVMNANDLNLARIFGVPAYHLGVVMNGSSTTYTNLEGLQLGFLQSTLVRYMNEIENALSDLLPYGQRVNFKEEGLLRTDTVTKWNIYKTQTDIGYTTGNELRKAEGKAPLTAQSMPKANPVTESEEENE